MDLPKPIKDVYRVLRKPRYTEPVSETPVEQPKRSGEQLVALSVPRAWTKRGIRTEDFEKLFGDYADELRASVIGAYGDGFTETRSLTENKWRFERGNLSVEYQASPNSSSTSGVSTYCGQLLIEQPEIDLERVARFVRLFIGHTLIAYQEKEPEFMIFHARNGEQNTILEGRPLLEKLGIEPTEGCKFHFGGGVAVWYPVDVKPKAVVSE